MPCQQPVVVVAATTTSTITSLSTHKALVTGGSSAACSTLSVTTVVGVWSLTVTSAIKTARQASICYNT